MIPEEPDLRRRLLGAGDGFVAQMDPVAGDSAVGQEFLELHGADRLEALIRIEHQDPVVLDLLEHGVARLGEILVPGHVHHTGSVALGDDPRVVAGTRIADDDFIDHRQRGLDGLSDASFFVAAIMQRLTV